MRATNLSNEFAKRGYSVDILVTKGMSDKPFFETHNNVHLVLLSEFNKTPNSAQLLESEKKLRSKIIKQKKFIRYFAGKIKQLDISIAYRIRFLRKGIEFRSYFLQEDPDIVIPFGLSYLEPILSAVYDLDCKVVYAEKNAPEKEFPSKNLEEYRYLIKLLKKTNAVIVQTQNSKQFFDNELDNVYVINNPIKQNLPMPFSGERRKTIVNFCRMSSQKNLELLLKAFKKLQAYYPVFKLEVYGNTVEESEEQYKELVLDKISEFELKDSAFILPPAADVHSRVLDAAMFVSSSDYEGLSNSMIEAMAIGLPCICTDCLGGGTREVMVDEENGLIVPMNDVDAMYQAMKQFVDNPEFAEECGRNASKIREKLSVEKTAQQWIDVFQR